MSGRSFALVIPAAGSGKRMQSDTPKPYLSLGGRLVLQHTLECFADVSSLAQVIVSTTGQYFDQTEELLQKVFPELPAKAVLGGEERQDSIWNCLQEVDPDVHLVAVHDAVRPFIAKETILETLDRADQKGGAIVAVPVKDTIKKADSQLKIKETPARSELWQAQTPQIFRRDLIMEAYESARRSGFTGTDDASLVEKIGEEVYIIEGGRENFKLTYPLDMSVAEMIIQKRSS